LLTLSLAGLDPERTLGGLGQRPNGCERVSIPPDARPATPISCIAGLAVGVRMPLDQFKRREFITLLGGASAWPLAVHAQQGEPVRRLGVLFGGEASDSRLSWFLERLSEVGWIEGRNLRTDIRIAAGNLDHIRMFAKELAELKPDVLAGNGGVIARALQQQTQTVPIVFLGGGASLDVGLVKSIARPEGNMTGITNLFPSIGGKWLELLKEADPHITRVALLFNPELLPGIVAESYLAPVEAAAAQYAVTATRTPFHSPADIETSIDAFASRAGAGLLALPPNLAGSNLDAINRAALRNKLPMISYATDRTAGGGLIFYGPAIRDIYRSGASYVDRLLRGAKVSDLPVQYPTTFELVVNLKTAKTIGLTLPPTLVARADEVIE
jgi:putative ABC transport system substrate-binding protein